MTYPPQSGDQQNDGGWPAQPAGGETWSAQTPATRPVEPGYPADPAYAAGQRHPDPAYAAGQGYVVDPAYAGGHSYQGTHGYPGDPAYAAGKGYPVGQPYPAVAYPPYGYPVAHRPTNGMAIASMVISIVGVVGLCGYGLGGYIGVAGAVLGHLSRRQIRERGEEGDGLAVAGVIMGWLATAIAVIATILIVVFIVMMARMPESGSGSTI